MKHGTVLLTGERGYLLNNLLPFLEANFDKIITLKAGEDISDKDLMNEIKYKNENIDCIIHFASPSDSNDFANKQRTCSTMIDGTINLVDIAVYHNSKFIFASSKAVNEVNHSIDNDYAKFKMAMECYITSFLDKVLILRIPRVYSKGRNKGLIKKLKDGTFIGDLNQKIDEVLFLDSFVFQSEMLFNNFFNNKINGIYYYSGTNTYQIKNLKDRFQI